MSTEEVGARARAAELARRLNLLLDAIQTETGERYSFERVQTELAAQGVSLSRGRWFYMLAGNGPLVTDPELLTALADMFEVDPDYLIRWDLDGVPARIDAQLELVRTLRLSKIKAVATRALGPLSTEGIRLLTEFVDREMGVPDGREHPASEQ